MYSNIVLGAGGLLPEASKTHLIRNIHNILFEATGLPHPLLLTCSNIRHIYSLEFPVHFISLFWTNIIWFMCNIFLGTPGLLAQAFHTFVIMNILIYTLWSSRSDSIWFQTYLTRSMCSIPL